MGGARKLSAGLILVAMFLGGLFMWLGNPYLWIRLTASQAKTQSMSLGQAVFILFAIALTGFAMTKVLAVLNSLYVRATGGSDEITIRPSWSRSLRDGRATSTTATALDVVMVVSVAIALVAVIIWFFFFARAS